MKYGGVDEHELRQFDCVADCNTIIRGYRKGISHYEMISSDSLDIFLK